jgi:hypothetical protein
LPEYSRNRFAQATQKRSLCPGQVMGVENMPSPGPYLPQRRQSLGS